MPRLLALRGRGGGWAKRPGRSRSADTLPFHEPKSQGRNGNKWPRGNFAPLKRLLDKRVGTPWNDVYSEIRAILRVSNVVHLHVIEHLEHFVELHPRFINGWPHCPTSGGALTCGCWAFFHVDEQGILRRNPPRGHQKRQR